MARLDICWSRRKGDIMLSIQGYYDGATIKPLEALTAKPNQRVIITLMDEYVEPAAIAPKKGMRGALAKHANPALAGREKGAWERATAEKHGDA